MSEFAVHVGHDVVPIHSTPIWDRHLSLEAKGLMAIVMSVYNQPDADVSVTELLSYTGLDIPASFSIFNELAQHRYLFETCEDPKNTQNDKRIFRIFFSPYPTADCKGA